MAKNKIFGVTFGRLPSPQTDASNPVQQLKGLSRPVTLSEIRPPSMDHLLHLKDRSKSKDTAKDRRSSQDRSAKRASTQLKPVKLDMILESPPALMIDAPEQSSGALISGRLQLTPMLPEAVLNSITMYLECTTTTKRPVHDRCRECSTQVNDLYEWNFLTQPKTLKLEQGKQELPFSHLIPGHIPVTTHGYISSIDYSLHVRARCADGQEIEYRREMIIKRALRPGNDKNSMRVFPPTNFIVHVTLPNIVHPIGEIPVLFRMEGITTTKADKQDRWRLRKMTWRIEEVEATISPACAIHAHKVGGAGKGVRHEHTRDVGAGELKSGWKTDFSEGQIECDFSVTIDNATKPQTGVDAGHGLKITHNLILELVIMEEWAPVRKLHSSTPTGAARVLRTQFGLRVTDRAGLGIAWDDEQPPMYEDVPASPPHYQAPHTEVAEYTGEDLHEDVEHLSLGS